MQQNELRDLGQQVRVAAVRTAAAGSARAIGAAVCALLGDDQAAVDQEVVK